MTLSAMDEAILVAGGTVIAATHRLARQIRQRYDRSRAASGARAWPTADVLPLDAWLRRTWEASAVRSAPPGHLRLLSDDEARLVWRRILAGDGRVDAGVVVPLVAGGWRLCQAWGISLASLQAGADSEDAQTFARWVQGYVEELQRRSWIDSATLLQRLGEPGPHAQLALAASGAARVGFAGFDPWTPALANLASALRGAGVAADALPLVQRGGACSVVAACNATDELAHAFTWAARHAHPDADPPPAIIIPTLEQDAAQVRRVGLDILAPGWRLDEPEVCPLALAVGRQLADYPIVHVALNLLDLLAFDISFEQASMLLRSCFVTGADAERAGRANAELRLRRIPLERLGLAALVRIVVKHAPVVAGRWQQAEALVATVRTRRLPPGQWAGHFATWLAAAGWPGDRGLNSEEFQAAEAWQRLLESYAGMDEVAGNLTLRAALGILGQQAKDRPFEPESASGAVQVLTLREAAGQAFRALWICGMTADQWPPPVRPHPLVPARLQQAAGLPEATPATLEAQTRRRFAELLASADHAVLSWPAEQDEVATLPSPLLAGVASVDSSAGTILSHPDRQRVADSGRIEIVTTDPPPPLPAGQGVFGGTRVLAMQAVCPARAFVEFRLGGAPLEPPARPLDAATRGKVVHRLLERLYRLEPCGRGLPDEQLLRELFEEVIGPVLDEFLQAGDPYHDGLRLIEVERLWPLLLTLRELDAERPGFSVATELAREAHIGPLSLSVRLDRVDRLDAGGELVIDYKTGKFAAGGWKRPRVPESQLPLYAVSGGCNGVAVVEFRPPAVRLRGIGVDGLDISGMKVPAVFFRESGLDWTGTLARWQAQLERLAREFSAGDFRVDPADRKWAAGQFAGLTRIHGFPPATADDELPEGGAE